MSEIVVGIDVGGTKIEAAALDRTGTVLAHARRPTLPGEAAVVAGIAEIVRAVTADAIRTTADTIREVTGDGASAAAEDLRRGAR